MSDRVAMKSGPERTVMFVAASDAPDLVLQSFDWQDDDLEKFIGGLRQSYVNYRAECEADGLTPQPWDHVVRAYAVGLQRVEGKVAKTISLIVQQYGKEPVDA